MSHNQKDANYNIGEVVALVAPVLEQSIEDIDHVIIVAIGRCSNCEHRDGLTIVATNRDPVENLEILEHAAIYILEGHVL